MIVIMAAKKFTPLALTDVTPYVAAMLVLLVIAVALVILTVVVSRPRRRTTTVAGAHRSASDKGEWLAEIEDVQFRFRAGEIGADDAFSELAGIARRFASDRLGRDVTNHTLAELHAVPRSRSNGKGLDLLKQTISALYPPEFADAATQAHAGETSVDEAAGWVSNLVERWRS
ncbi:hypothetical protein [Bifidobacterium callimiconis]|uniref:Uncharacterized protein n=1 Tax=Bifidobacterium callimiconis TaxID=2306973 RepID=A0A430FGJ0_9BIFI|nr:hypothetical protein [Bifidobacterium callimiconis]MBT1176607.1 hypothetical protein [Bifidobacterium callimiconis]RSX51937.1 hypothetical protein D2E23_0544 [Bifidobacterium callimiconis]